MPEGMGAGVTGDQAGFQPDVSKSFICPTDPLPKSRVSIGHRTRLMRGPGGFLVLRDVCAHGHMFRAQERVVVQSQEGAVRRIAFVLGRIGCF